MNSLDWTLETIQELKIENNIIKVKCGDKLPFVRLFTNPATEFKINPLKDKCLLYMPRNCNGFPVDRAFAILQESSESIEIKNESDCSVLLNKDGIKINAGNLPIEIDGVNVKLGDGLGDVLTKTNFMTAIITPTLLGVPCTIDLSSITNKVKS